MKCIAGNVMIFIFFSNLFNCRQPHQHIHLKEKKQVLIIKKWKETSTYWKFKDKIFKLF